MKKRLAPSLLKLAFWTAVVFAFAMGALPQPAQYPGDSHDKLLHVLAFATLSILGCLAYPRMPLIRLGLGLSVFGAAIEAVQEIPVLNRDSEFLDWVADTAAITVVLFAVFLWRRRAIPD